MTRDIYASVTVLETRCASWCGTCRTTLPLESKYHRPAIHPMATNAAFVAAKAAGQPPAKLAAAIVERLQRAAGNYVAGMIDRYAMDEHRRLTDLSVSG
jgi:dGTP triphosphohydrolase